jgi:hypothetical protein
MNYREQLDIVAGQFLEDGRIIGTNQTYLDWRM